MKFFLCCVNLLALILITESAKKVDVKSRVKQTVTLIKAFGKREAKFGGRKPNIGELLSLAPEEDVQAKSTVVPNSRVHLTRYEETYKGLPVFDSIVTAAFDRSTGDVTEQVTGKIYQGIDSDLSDTTPSITEDDAFNIAMKKEGHDSLPNLEIRDKKIVLMVKMDQNDIARLVYYLSYVAEGPGISKLISRPTYIINAKTGIVMDNWEGLDTSNYLLQGVGGNQKSGKHLYDGVQFKKLNVAEKSGVCSMENAKVQVFHMNSGTKCPISPYVFPCSTGANDPANGAFSPANDALYFGTQVVDMYDEWTGSSPMAMAKLKMKVHYGVDYDNAFWDGSYVTFGDGGVHLHPLVSLDMVAHEISHAYTDQNSQLIYKYQSGAMNEAFSDMAGEAAKYFVEGSNDWKVAYDVVKYAGYAMRYMNSPTTDGYSIDHAGMYNDQIDVHYSSGVYNKAFYLLATKKGWNTKKAFQVFALANKSYWSANSSFEEGACGVQSAANDKGFSADDVAAAFSDVGIKCA